MYVSIGEQTEKIIRLELKKSKGADAVIDKLQAIKNIRQQLYEFYSNKKFTSNELLKRLNEIDYFNKNYKEYVMAIILGILGSVLAAYMTSLINNKIIESLMISGAWLVNLVTVVIYLAFVVLFFAFITHGTKNVLSIVVKWWFAKDYKKFIYPCEKEIIENILKNEYNFKPNTFSPVSIPQKVIVRKRTK